MGQIVFNYKTCDHEKWCPAKTACEKNMNVADNHAAIYYDSKTRKIKVNGELCASFNCKEQLCTRQCQYFKYAFTNAEKWVLDQEIELFTEDPNYYFIPRFNAGGCQPHIRIDYEELITLVANNKSLLLVEITNARSSISIFEAVKYSTLLPDEIYNSYFRKLFVTDLNILQAAEDRFRFFELPAILVFDKDKCVDRITGICKNNEPAKINIMRQKLKNHISNILNIN